jgi:hypothetical protein
MADTSPAMTKHHRSQARRIACAVRRPLGQDRVHRTGPHRPARERRDEAPVLSAPTSFGKSLIIDALLASGKFDNVVIIVPTIALIDETRRRLSRFRQRYKIITHPSQESGERNVFVLTQERAVDRKDVDDIDLLVIDEFYKLDIGDGDDGERAAFSTTPSTNCTKNPNRYIFWDQVFREFQRASANDSSVPSKEPTTTRWSPK